MSSKVKTVTFFSTLMHYAKAVGKAKLHGTPEELAAAQKQHDDYKELCLQADEMRIDMPDPRIFKNI